MIKPASCMFLLPLYSDIISILTITMWRVLFIAFFFSLHMNVYIMISQV